MTEYPVADVDEIKEGGRILVQIKGKPIGIFKIDGEYHAYLSWCPHQSAPCAEGNITGRQQGTFDSDTLETKLEYVSEGEILNCPWHAWEFDLKTGDCLTTDTVSLPSFPVEIKDNEIIVDV